MTTTLANRGGTPPIVLGLVIANVAVFALQMFAGVGFTKAFALWPWVSVSSGAGGVGPTLFAPWQLVTYAFLHGGLLHLAFNLYGLWFFGQHIEAVWGARRFAIFYAVCVIGAGIVQLIVATNSGELYPTVGASGGVFGVLLAFGLMYPNARLMLLFPPVPLQAKYFVLIYAGLELWLGVTGTAEGVAHFAHLGGMLFGLLLIVYWGTLGRR
ncbi:MAG: rhomboid family intramembrane serine protease [Chromatiales bacterium]|nr:rhomboid family intramembrane serine protease [Chromatiales bacterium]